MRCTRLLDWLEEHGGEMPTQEWQDLVAHSRSCVDCSLALAQRGELLESLRNLPAPEVPPELSRNIFEALDREGHPPSTSDLIERILGSLVKPVQVGLSLACVAMALNLFLASPPGQAIRPIPTSNPSNMIARKNPPLKTRSLQQLPGNTLPPPSQKEVNEFLMKMKEFRELHPEMYSTGDQPPAAETVVFRETP